MPCHVVMSVVVLSFACGEVTDGGENIPDDEVYEISTLRI